MNIGGKEFSEDELVMLLLAVKHVLTDERNIVRNNAALRATAVHIGLVNENDVIADKKT